MQLHAHEQVASVASVGGGVEGEGGGEGAGEAGGGEGEADGGSRDAGGCAGGGEGARMHTSQALIDPSSLELASTAFSCHTPADCVPSDASEPPSGSHGPSCVGSVTTWLRPWSEKRTIASVTSWIPPMLPKSFSSAPDGATRYSSRSLML